MLVLPWIFLVSTASAFPLNWIRSLSDSINFESFDNHLPRAGDLPKYKYETNQIQRKIDSVEDMKIHTGDKMTTNEVEEFHKMKMKKGSQSNPMKNAIVETMTKNSNGNKTRKFDKAKTFEQILDYLRESPLSDSKAENTIQDPKDYSKESTTRTERKTDRTTEFAPQEVTPRFENRPERTTEFLFNELQEATPRTQKGRENVLKEAQVLESTSVFIEEVLEATTMKTIDEMYATEENNLGTTTFDGLNNRPRHLDPVNAANQTTANSNATRPTRQREDGSGEETDNNRQNQQQSDGEDFERRQSDESEEDMNMLTGLISAFLGGLSRPDGSIDVEAITGLLGSLSMQNDDGSYDFNGLTELLMSFFGGGGEEGGGSDLGAFVGGLLGALIKGVAMPPGAKGAGIFTGKVLTGILPALSAPAPTEEGSTDKPQAGSDSGNFLSGLLQTLIGSSGSLSEGLTNSSGNQGGGGGGSVFPIFKMIFSLITSVFSSSSSSKQWK